MSFGVAVHCTVASFARSLARSGPGVAPHIPNGSLCIERARQRAILKGTARPRLASLEACGAPAPEATDERAKIYTCARTHATTHNSLAPSLPPSFPLTHPFIHALIRACLLSDSPRMRVRAAPLRAEMSPPHAVQA